MNTPPLKVLQLNVWMGKVEGNLRRFLTQNPYDVICMQEVMASSDATLHLSRLCFSLAQILEASGMPYYFFSPNYSSIIGPGHFELGNLILSRIPIRNTWQDFVHGAYQQDFVYSELPKNNLNIQAAELENGLIVINHHGYWVSQPMGNEHSIAAFNKVASFIHPFTQRPLVMCGDLNIEHISPAMRPLDFLRDLTHEAGVKNTLSGLKYDGQVACDHILVNGLVQVEEFSVLPDLVSDHLPLSCTVSLK